MVKPVIGAVFGDIGGASRYWGRRSARVQCSTGRLIPWLAAAGMLALGTAAIVALIPPSTYGG